MAKPVYDVECILCGNRQSVIWKIDNWLICNRCAYRVQQEVNNLSGRYYIIGKDGRIAIDEDGNALTDDPTRQM